MSIKVNLSKGYSYTIKLIERLMMQKLDKLTQTQRISLKIQLIKQISIPRRKKSPSRSQSLKVIYPKIAIPKINSIITQTEERNNKQDVFHKVMTSNSQIMLKRTNLQFKINTNSSSINHNFTIQHWMPTKQTTSFTRRNISKQKQYREQRNFVKPATISPGEIAQKKYQPKDGQSILRKSSLFLLNSIKSKEKRNSKIEEVGKIPILFQKIQRSKIPYDDIKTQRQQRQRKFIQNLKFLKQQRSSRKTQENEVLLYPEPW